MLALSGQLLLDAFRAPAISRSPCGHALFDGARSAWLAIQAAARALGFECNSASCGRASVSCASVSIAGSSAERLVFLLLGGHFFGERLQLGCARFRSSAALAASRSSIGNGRPAPAAACASISAFSSS